jgi:hypothetical protein
VEGFRREELTGPARQVYDLIAQRGFLLAEKVAEIASERLMPQVPRTLLQLEKIGHITLLPLPRVDGLCALCAEHEQHRAATAHLLRSRR